MIMKINEKKLEVIMKYVTITLDTIRERKRIIYNIKENYQEDYETLNEEQKPEIDCLDRLEQSLDIASNHIKNALYETE